MADRLAMLEQRMQALLTRLEECKVTLNTLTQENTKLRAENKEVEALKKENRQLVARINQFEKELKMNGSRSAEIKSKIKGAIERIDSIEREIARL
jgi:regulator of replication initiation timing